MKKHRMSSLPIAEHCGRSAYLSARYGSGRRAAMSSAFHATCAGEPHAPDLMNALTDEERAEVMTWYRPTDVQVGDVTLRYADAHKEEEVEIAGIVGHPDMFWIVGDTVYVGDIKATRWASMGPDSLQIQGYALAVAENANADKICGLVWLATEAEWQIGEVHDLWEVGDTLRSRIEHAAKQPDEATTGPHCDHCYARLHCDEWLLPATFAETALAPLAERNHDEVTAAQATQAVHLVKRMKAVADVADKWLKEYARRNGGIHDPDTGLVYKPVECKGRESVSTKAVREKYPEIADELITRGKNYHRFQWVKP